MIIMTKTPAIPTPINVFSVKLVSLLPPFPLIFALCLLEPPELLSEPEREAGEGTEEDEEGTRFDPPAGGESKGCEGFLGRLGFSEITGGNGDENGGESWLPDGGDKGFKGGDGGEIGLLGSSWPLSLGLASGC